HLIVGYGKDAERALNLSAAIEKQSGARLVLVQGDLAEKEVRRKYLDAARNLAAPLAGAAIFPGSPARVALQDLDRESLLGSLESNYIGPVLLARDIGEAMENQP